MGHTDQSKLTAYFQETPEMELAKTKNLFDVTKDRFHHTLASAIDPPAMGTVQFGAHGLKLIVIMV